MAADPGVLELMRGDLAEVSGIVEKRMFGGLCFMKDGHMLCGAHRDGAMYRVGKPRAAEALALPGVREMGFTGRPMPAFVEVAPEDMDDEGTRAALLALALANVASLPPRG
ncbi:TfoX/Sxy family protein [Litorisediminicola beolgyonensis]|uniref:TfoX/Sxy family protein n=1 Tax=Litorisediminicola beolgyonensis TaxID=1173614 RepID=A0ABW3ZDS4_9RHOB